MDVTTAPLGGAPDTVCSQFDFGGRKYWFCLNDRSFSTARTKCQGINFDLAAIESSGENTFIRSHLLVDAWIGGSDSATEGAWKWLQTNSQFWQGTAGGSVVGMSYVNWKTLQPSQTGDQDCLLMDDNDGKWSDEACSGLRDFVCEGDDCPSDPNKTEPGQCGCGVADTDGDGDGTANCNDGCPSDASKSSPGACGCGVPDTDGDHDGALDCNDECPTDERYIVKGDCGCGDDPEPAGTACNDGLCSANTTCDAAGTCGSPNTCKPDTNCTLRYYLAQPYWFCDTDRTFDQARQKCQAKNMDLLVIRDAAENAFVHSNINVHVYLGATDAATEGEWIWAPTGEKFWTGGQLGTPVGGAYENWETFEPDGSPSFDDCAVIEPLLSGHWESKTCTYPRDYVCKRNDACPTDPDKLTPGQCGCGLEDTDSDGDGTADCKDLCPDDNAKTAPGACDCGNADTDGDGDGIADCLDECPMSADATAGGTCGCPPAAAPAGTPCDDGICGPGVCDGAGHCGTSSCSPDPSCPCTVTRVDGRAFWFCPCGKTRDAAATACGGNLGRQLLQIGSARENAYVASRITNTTWIGANDRGSEGVWRWTTPQHGDAGPQFWTGTQTGEPFFGRYANWQSTDPNGGTGANCAVMSAAVGTRGQWLDIGCGTTAQVACEVGLRRLGPNGTGTTGPNGGAPGTLDDPCTILGLKCPPDSDENECVPADEVFEEPTLAEQEQAFRNCTACVNDPSVTDPAVQCTAPWPGPTDPIPCSGSATPPPVGSTCTPFTDGLPMGHVFECPLVPGSWGAAPVRSCEDDDPPCPMGSDCGLVFSCSECPAGEVCPCDGDDNDTQCPGLGNQCLGRKLCGDWIEECPNGDSGDDVRCSEVYLCPDENTETHTFDDLRENSNLDTIETAVIEDEFGPADMPANATQLPSDPPCPGEADPENCTSDPSHRWCRYAQPDEVTPRDVLPDGRTGDAGNPATVEFFFTPRLDFSYDLTPGPFGLMQFDLGATAALSAGAEIHVLGADERLDVVDFLLQIRGGLQDAEDDMEDICGVKTGSSHVIILEQADILPASFKIDVPDAGVQDDCIAGLKEFQETADRVKKAYSDARELLRQYKDLKAAGTNFGVGLDGLCDQIASNLPEDFPIGEDCLTEPPEETLNRFIDYYSYLVLERLTGPVVDQVAGAIDEAFGATDTAFDIFGINNSEEIVLLNQQFFIGPIPCNLQVLFTVSYGLDLDGVLKFRPSSLIRTMMYTGPTAAEAEDPFAYIGAIGSPRAGAGLALFVGVGFDIGIAAAKIGIEGSVSLGTIGLPLEAGAGVAIATQPDTRAHAADVDSTYEAVGDPPLIPLKKYSINAVYKYGATLTIENLLSGKIDAVLKLKFLFFSKKYRATLARFSGLCTPENPKPFCTTDIFGGYGNFAEIPFEMIDWGTVLMPTRFLQLKRFSPTDRAPPGKEPINPGRAGELFYDSLCSCIPRYDTIEEGDEVEACSSASDCCGYEEGDFCFADPEDDGFGKCSACRGVGETCNDVSDCCAAGVDIICLDDPGDMLSYGTCRPKSVCGEPCQTDDDCNDTTILGDLVCFQPDSGPPFFNPLPEERECRRAVNTGPNSCSTVD